jgi:hypothetical protein
MVFDPSSGFDEGVGAVGGLERDLLDEEHDSCSPEAARPLLDSASNAA